jgi:hypothetical protein
MKGNYMNNSEEEIKLQLRPRTAEIVSLNIPIDTLASLEKIAANRDMSVQALLKFYIGQGLREDLAKVFSERLLDKTAQVLARHLESAEEISTILREIQAETAR